MDHVKEIMIVGFLFIIVLITSNEFFITIFIGGVILGAITAFKFSKDKVGGLIVFALAIIFIPAIIFALIVGQDSRYIDTNLLTPYQLSIYQKLSVISTILYGFILGCAAVVTVKTYIKNRKISKKTNGKLVCEKCGNYYKLEKGESPDDFSDKCECGGHLEYKEAINK